MNLAPLNFSQLIAELDQVMSHDEISQAVGCSKSNISAIKRGTEPKHHLGEKIKTVHQEKIGKED